LSGDGTILNKNDRIENDLLESDFSGCFKKSRKMWGRCKQAGMKMGPSSTILGWAFWPCNGAEAGKNKYKK
jgi:hypothetical protein